VIVLRTQRQTSVRGGTTALCVIGALVVIVGSAFSRAVVSAQDPAFQWNIPAPFPKPHVPADNPMNIAKVELGRRLFYDTRLSVNGKQSCASCHQQELAFTDGKAQSVGTMGATHPRGSMSLANIAYNPRLTWANPYSRLLEDQALVPMLGTDPVELGMTGVEPRILQEINRDTLYQRLFPEAFRGASIPRDSLFSITSIVRAIAAFERTIVSLTSPYDRYRFGGDTNAISASAKRGEVFFFSGQKGGCFQCHGGWNFNGAVRYEGRTDVDAGFFNTGLYNVAGATSYPVTNTGLHALTGNLRDVGRFRAPTLRNIAVTSPYMHDGSVKTLGEVLDHYAAGGRTIRSGANAGEGRNNPNKAPNVRPFPLSAQDKQDVIAFLETLTDSAFLRDPAYANPWKRDRR
jgi:cytochrome c peroxidase